MKGTDVLDAIMEMMVGGNPPPSRRELAAHLGHGVSTIQYHVKRLEKDGKIVLRRNVARGILLGPSRTPKASE
jgi:DNA-binding MarR family transcriptional regulator